MSLFGELAGEAFAALTTPRAGSGPAPATQILTQLIQNHPSGNGLSGLLEQLAAAGLGSEVQSWLGSGANQPVSPAQIQQALGPAHIQQLAQQYGMDPNIVSTAIAHLLPHAVDHLTPNGVAPSPSDNVAGALEGLLTSAFFKR